MYAFRLKADLKESFSGGSVVCSPLGHTFDIGQALKDNELIYTTNEFLGEQLARYPALSRVPDEEVPKDLEPVKVPGEGQVMTAEVLTRQTPAPRGEGEIPAEHKDPINTPEDAVQAGEEVSGQSAEGEQSSGTEQEPAQAGAARRFGR